MSSKHWQQYWKQAVVSSFGKTEPDWYRQELVPFWENLFSGLPDGVSVLDIATGNGAVTRIAASVNEREHKQLELHAVDRVETTAVPGVELLPPSPLETLTSEQRYNLVTAQFGLEYSRIVQSLPAIVRLLEPEAQLVVIAHHLDSRISHFSREEMEQYRAIFQQQDLFPRLEKLLTIMGDTRSPRQRQQLVANPRAQAARKAVNRSISQLTGHFPEGIVIANLLKQINPLFQQMMNLSLDDKLAYLRSIRKELQLARLRLADQLDAAWSERDVSKMQVQAEKLGLETRKQEVIHSQDGELLAWNLSFRKTAD